IVTAVLLAAKWVVPAVLHQVVSVRSRELFITVIILLCLGTALLTSHFGLSLALGAFLAGLVISESEYAHQAMSDILPFKDSFIGFFFVSVGMLMDVGYLAGNWLIVSAEVAVIFVIKVVAGATAAAVVGLPLRAALVAGLGLAQIGEFSFVLAGAGYAAGLIAGDFFQLFLSASLVTMLLTPFVIKAAPGVSTWVSARIFRKRFRRFAGKAERALFPRGKSEHVVIVGFGLNGRNLARVLKQADIPYVVLEMNSDTAREMKSKGEPIYYGDGTSIEILRKMGIGEARVLVVAISDAASARRIVGAAKRENPGLHIIVRSRYISEVDDLRSLGADEVIPEEFETS
ncbi:MAG: cation:proton antiporter, partial [bacterium]|nr:cation:proton antiporter [bacterium]